MNERGVRYVYWRKEAGRTTYCPRGRVGYSSVEKVPFSKMYKTLFGCVRSMKKDKEQMEKWSRVPVSYGVDVVQMEIVSRETISYPPIKEKD